MDVRRSVAHSHLFEGWPRLQEEHPVHLPGWNGENHQQEQRQTGRGLAGRVEAPLLLHPCRSVAGWDGIGDDDDDEEEDDDDDDDDDGDGDDDDDEGVCGYDRWMCFVESLKICRRVIALHRFYDWLVVNILMDMKIEWITEKFYHNYLSAIIIIVIIIIILIIIITARDVSNFQS